MRKLVFIFSIFCAISTVEAQENIPSVDIETINGKEINTHDISEDKLVGKAEYIWLHWRSFSDAPTFTRNQKIN